MNEKEVSRALLALLIGATVGTGIALLFAPRLGWAWR
ncbi:MAG: YtxH domain-containing protein [Nitrospirota bacterium]